MDTRISFSVDLLPLLFRDVGKEEQIRNVARLRIMYHFHEPFQVSYAEEGAACSEDTRMGDESLERRTSSSDGHALSVDDGLCCEIVDAREGILGLFDAPIVIQIATICTPETD